MNKKYQSQDSVLFCVATEKGFSVLQAVNKSFEMDIHVSTFREVKVANSFDEKIKLFAKKNKLPMYAWKDVRKEGINWLKKNRIGAIVCVGWRFMIPKDWINYLSGRVLITHDSLLPKYRGFAPLVSALINGEKETGLKVMLAGSEMDTGDIIYQRKIGISPNCTIDELIKVLLPLFDEGIVSSLKKIFSGKIKRKKQDHSKATYSIWRDEIDLLINWNESASRIERTIRALGNPYMGARTRCDSEEVVVHKSEVVPGIPFEIQQPGKVWKLTHDGKPVVVCGKDMLIITEASIGDKSLIPMKKLRVRFL